MYPGLQCLGAVVTAGVLGHLVGCLSLIMMQYRLRVMFWASCMMTSIATSASFPSSQVLALIRFQVRQAPHGSSVLQMFKLLSLSATSAASLRSGRAGTSLCNRDTL